jgi:hypothetical protein
MMRFVGNIKMRRTPLNIPESKQEARSFCASPDLCQVNSQKQPT